MRKNLSMIQIALSLAYGTEYMTTLHYTLARFGLSFSTVPVRRPRSGVENRTLSPASKQTCASSGGIGDARPVSRFPKKISVQSILGVSRTVSGIHGS